jgi:hypothetical protein
MKNFLRLSHLWGHFYHLKDMKNMLWKCIACNEKNQKDCGTLHIYRQNTRHKELLMGRLKDDNKRFLLNLLQTLCCKKKCRKKRRKMNEDWLSIQTKNVRFYFSIFCYTFFSYLPSYYLSKTFIQSGTVATTYIYNMIYKKHIQFVVWNKLYTCFLLIIQKQN